MDDAYNAVPKYRAKRGGRNMFSADKLQDILSKEPASSSSRSDGKDVFQLMEKAGVGHKRPPRKSLPKSPPKPKVPEVEKTAFNLEIGVAGGKRQFTIHVKKKRGGGGGPGEQGMSQ
jgi:hypothetical protein